jgi:predicted phage tail protein
MIENNIMHRVIQGAKGGGKGGGGTQRAALEAPNTLQSKATLRVVEILSEGEILGLVDGAKSITFDGTPLQSSDGTYNFNGINYQLRTGTPDQAHIEGFTAVESEVTVGTQVMATAPIVRTITDSDVDAVRVTLRFNGLSEQDKTNGDLNGSQVVYTIEYQPNGGSYIMAVDQDQGIVTGKTTSTYELQRRINLTGAAPWNIRVTRITPDNEAVNIVNDMFWSSYTLVLDHKLIYPDCAIIGHEVDSSLFGANVPQRAYEIYGIVVQVPSNYTPSTRAYDGVWDGTFQRQWSDNPVWVLYDMLSNKRYGLGNYIDVDEVDKYGLYEIAQYCDGLVDDGQGGLEPRFTCNIVVEKQDDALKVLQLVASAFRGMLYWGAQGDSGIITAVNDAPADAIKIFTPANVKDGLFTYSSSASTARHSAIYVTWNDPDNGYEPAIEVVESPSISDIRLYRTDGVVALGCTSRGQAHRFGKWILDKEEYGDETVSFSVGLADADLRPGHVVKIADPAYSDVRAGGRIISATTDQVTLDAPFEIEAGELYTIDVILPDGSLAEATIANTPGTYTVMDFDDSLPQVPAALTMWAITSTSLAPRQFRVVGVKEVTPIEFEVAAVLHDPNQYARVERDITLTSTPFSKLVSGVPTVPSNMTFFEFLVSSGALVRSAVTVSWRASTDSRVVRYELEAMRPGGSNNYEIVKSTNGLTHTIEGTIDGTWSFRLRAFDALNTPSSYVYATNVSLVINGTPPDDVEDFAITNLTDTSILTWSPVTNKNISHYELRYSSLLVGAAWNSSIVVSERIAKDLTTTTIASRTGSFLIKAVTLPTNSHPMGVYSRDPSIISTDVDFLRSFDFVQDVVENPTFSGNKTDVVVNAGNLELDVSAPDVHIAFGVYEHDTIVDLTDVYNCRVTPHIVVAGNLTTNLVDDWANVDLITNVDGGSDGQWAVTTQISTTKDDPGGSPVWSDYTNLDVGDVNTRAMKFRTLLYSYYAPVTPSIEELSISIHMPGFIQSGEDLVSDDSADTIVTFPSVFRSTRPAVVITPQGMATGDYVDLDPADINETGFTFNIRDNMGARVERTFDYHVKGFGVLIT